MAICNEISKNSAEKGDPNGGVSMVEKFTFRC